MTDRILAIAGMNHSHVHDDTTPHLAFHDGAGSFDDVIETDALREGMKTGRLKVPRQTLPGLKAKRLGCHDGIDAKQGHAAQDEGGDA